MLHYDELKQAVDDGYIIGNKIIAPSFFIIFIFIGTLYRRNKKNLG